jgi:probable HAF family extracellular repeat protein
MRITASRTLRALASPAAFVFALSALFLTTTATAQPAGIRERGVRLLDLGTLGGTESSAWAIDESGKVVGWSLLASGQRRAFTSCADCTMQDLGTHVGGSDSIGRAVSSNGQWLAGSSAINAHGPGFAQFTQGFAFNSGTMSSVDALFCPCTFNQRHGTSEAYGVNDSGTVVGWAPSPRANYYHAFIWKDGVIQDLSDMGLGDPSWSRAYDINNAEQIVGYIDRDDSMSFSEADRDAFIWENGAFRTLDHLPGHISSTAVAINDTGLAVGWSGDVTGSVSRAALWSGAQVTELGHLSGDSNSQALAVNDRRQVVGWSGNAEGDTRAVFWQDGFLMDLNSLLPANSGWQLIEARGINNRGMIVGTARINGELRAFLLIPPSAQRLRNEARN